MWVKNDSYYMLDYGQGFDPLLGVKITPVFLSVSLLNAKLAISDFNSDSSARLTRSEISDAVVA